MLIGVTKKKYTIAIIMGAMIIPKISPNLIQALFSGVRNLESSNPNPRKTPDTIKKLRLKSPEFFKGQSPKIKNTTKNSKPKLLLELLDFI